MTWRLVVLGAALVGVATFVAWCRCRMAALADRARKEWDDADPTHVYE